MGNQRGNVGKAEAAVCHWHRMVVVGSRVLEAGRRGRVGDLLMAEVIQRQEEDEPRSRRIMSMTWRPDTRTEDDNKGNVRLSRRGQIGKADEARRTRCKANEVSL